MKGLILFLFILIFSSCSILNKSSKKVYTPKKGFSLTLRSTIPDEIFSVTESKKSALLVNALMDVDIELIKTDLNLEFILKNKSYKKVEPIRVSKKSKYYEIDYKFIHRSDIFKKLSLATNIENVLGKGDSFNEALENAFVSVLKKNVNKKEYKLLAHVNLVSIDNLKYNKKEVELSLKVLVNVGKISDLNNYDIANSYANEAIKNIYKKNTSKAMGLILDCIKKDKNCDACYYANSLYYDRDLRWNDAVKNIKKAIALDKNKLKYYQHLQSLYFKIYKNMGKQTPKDIKREAWINEAYMKKHFNEDGSLIKREKPPLSNKKPSFKFPKLEKEKLANGLEITKIHKGHLPILEISIGFNFGSAHNPKGKMGLIKAMFSLLEDGVEGMNSEEIARYIDNNGIYLYNSVNGDFSTLNCAALSENIDSCVFLLDKILNKATFLEKEFNKYMKMKIEENSLDLSSSSYLANKLLYRLVYPNHPYMYYDATLKTLNNIKLDDVKNFYDNYLNPLNAYVLISGNYNDEINSKISKMLLKWKSKNNKKNTTITKKVESLKDNREFIYFIHRKNSSQASIRYSQTTIKFSNDDFISLSLGNQVFGGGASSRLFMRLREKESLTYGAYSGLSEKQEKGIFTAALDVRNEVTGQALNSLLDELSILKEKGITQKELDRIKDYEIGKLSLKLEKISAFNDELMKKHFFNIKDYNIIERINKTKLEDVNRTLKEIIQPKSGIVVIVGDYNKIKDQLKNFNVIVFDENLKALNIK